MSGAIIVFYSYYSSLPNPPRMIMNHDDVPSLQRSSIPYPTPNAEPATSCCDSLLHWPVVSRGVGEHDDECHLKLEIGRHAERRAMAVAYGMLQLLMFNIAAAILALLHRE